MKRTFLDSSSDGLPTFTRSQSPLSHTQDTYRFVMSIYTLFLVKGTNFWMSSERVEGGGREGGGGNKPTK